MMAWSILSVWHFYTDTISFHESISPKSGWNSKNSWYYFHCYGDVVYRYSVFLNTQYLFTFISCMKSDFNQNGAFSWTNKGILLKYGYDIAYDKANKNMLHESLEGQREDFYWASIQNNLWFLKDTLNNI